MTSNLNSEPLWTDSIEDLLPESPQSEHNSTVNCCPVCQTAYSGNYCSHCGLPRTDMQPDVYVCKKWTAFFLCLFLGTMGAHRFYERKVATGVLYLFTFGLLGIGRLVDLIRILMKPDLYLAKK